MQPPSRQTSFPIFVIGVGNEQRGDDGIGLLVARRLRASNLPGVTVLESSGEGAALMEAWKGARRIFLVDAVCSGLAPGTVRRFAAHDRPLPARPFAHTSTHAFGLVEALELARALGQLPPQVIVYGIEGGTFAPGAPLSPEVAQAAEKVARQIVQETRSGS
jgi:hydrogenase maturation protease